MLLFKDGLCLINRLSFNSSKNFLFLCVRILKLSYDAEWLQNSKWSATELFLGLTSFLISGDIPICSPILTFRCLTHSPYWESLQSPHWNLWTTPEVRSLGIRSLKWKLLTNLVLFLKYYLQFTTVKDVF